MALLFDDAGAFPESARGPQAAGLSLRASRAAADDLARWLIDSGVPRNVMLALPAAVVEACECDAGTPRADDLAAVLSWWNGLHDEGLVPHGVRTFRLSAEIRRAWKTWCSSAELQEEWRDLARIEEEIRASSFCREGWFRLEKLLGGHANRDGCPIIRKLLDGGYRDGAKRQAADNPFAEFARRHA